MNFIEKLCDKFDNFVNHILCFIDNPVKYFNQLIDKMVERKKEQHEKWIKQAQFEQEQRKQELDKFFKAGQDAGKAMRKKTTPSKPIPPPEPQPMEIKKGVDMSDELKKLQSGMNASKSTDKLLTIAAMIGEVDKETLNKIMESREVSIKLNWNTDEYNAGPLPELDIKIK